MEKKVFIGEGLIGGFFILDSQKILETICDYLKLIRIARC
jgi:hypothetical protein